MNFQEKISNLVQQIKDSNKTIEVISTGVGAGILPLLWSQPGISSVLHSFSFPYATSATDAILGFKPTGYASSSTAVDLAHSAFKRAWKPDSKTVGVGVCGAVSSNTERRGNNRVHIAIQSDEGCQTIHIPLPELSSRSQDGIITDYITISLLAISCGIPNTIFKEVAEFYHLSIEYKENNLELSTERLFAHNYFSKDGKRTNEIEIPVSNLILFPGTFNPPHLGHFGIAKKLSNTLNTHFIFEISADPQHKTPPTVAQLLGRAKMLEGHNVVITRGCPLLIHKAERFTGNTFVLGSDTLERIFSPQWCEDPEKLTQKFVDYKVKFIIFGREYGGHWNDLFVIQRQFPAIKKLNTTAIKGRWDISSTEIRQQTAPTVFLQKEDFK